MKTIGIDCRLWNETGVGRYIRNLILELEKIDNKNDYKLFILKKDSEEIKNLVHSPHFTVVIADFRWHSLAEQFMFPIILYKENLDLMHFTYFSVPLLYFKKFTVTIHDMITWKYATGRASTLPSFIYWLKQFTYRIVIFISSKRAQFIITPSNSVKDEVSKLLKIGKNKIKVIYEGFDTLINSKEKFNKSEKYFLYVGNAYPHKNLNFLINAFARFNIDKNFKLLLVGNDNYFYSKLKKYVINEKIINVEFLGFVDDKKLAELYKNSLALIIPSLSEGFGLPAIEAMSLGTPVICSKIKVFEDICNDVPFYFNPKDEISLLNELEKFIKTPKSILEEKIKKGLTLTKKLSWEKMAKETLKIYENSISL